MLTKDGFSHLKNILFSNSKNFKTRLLLLVFLPIIIIIYLIINQAYITYTTLKNTKSLENFVLTSTKISSLVHEIQKERGMSAGFLGANGKAFKQQLIAQQIVVDSKLKAVIRHILNMEKINFDNSFNSYINKALTKTIKVDKIRKLILSRKLSFVKSIEYFNEINGLFLLAIGTLPQLINDANISRQLIGYHAFLLVKESAGIERGVLTHVFYQDKIVNEHYVKFISLLAAQKSYLNLSMVISDKEIKEYYAVKLNRQAISEVDRIRQVAINRLDREHTYIDPNYWFIEATKKINLLKDVEDYSIAYVLSITQELAGKARNSLILSVILGGGVIFCIIAFSRQKFTDLTENFDVLLTRVKKHHQQKLDNFEQTIISFVDIIEKRDAYTAGHTKRVAYFSQLIAKEMNYSDSDINRLQKAALLHDIGKIQTPDNILLKPGKLSNSEFELMKGHSNAGYNMLKDINMYKSIASIMRFHHERFDGKGYPDGLQGNEIPPLSRILIVADAFDAMTTSRIYKPRKTVAEALKELKELSGVQFHPEVASAAIKVLKEVECVDSIHQNPLTIIEKERFSYFYKDPLTNCYNKKFYAMKLQESTKNNEFKNKTDISLRNFGLYNDTFGWDKGDIMLKIVANFLLDTFENDLVFRVEGDDFKVLHRENLSTELSIYLCKQLEDIDDSGILIAECESKVIYFNPYSDKNEAQSIA